MTPRTPRWFTERSGGDEAAVFSKRRQTLETWLGLVSNNAAVIRKIHQKGIQDRATIVSKNAEDFRRIQQRGYENQRKGQDQNARQYDQYVRGTETYQIPTPATKSTSIAAASIY
jgi:hypothetical protein